MAIDSVQGNRLGRSQRPKECPDCGEVGRALYIPEYLPYEKAKAYRGKRVCASCAPRFSAPGKLDFGGIA